MSIGNLIRKNDKFDKEYTAEVMSNADTLKRGRLQVKIPTLMGDIPFWVNSTLVTGTVNFLMIPDAGDKVSVKFRNKDIYSGEWELKGNPNNEANIDPNKYGLKDSNGNTIIVDKSTNEITIKGTTIVIEGGSGATAITLKGNTKIDGDLEVTKSTSIGGTNTAYGLSVGGKVKANDAEFTLGGTYDSPSQVKATKGVVK